MNSTRFQKQSMRALWKLMSQQESVWNHLYRKSWRSHRKQRIQFDESFQFGTQIYSDASSDENSGCESSSRQGMEEEARNNSSLAVGQSEEQKGGHSGSTKRQQESPLCYIDGHLSSQKCGVRTKFQKYKGRVVLRGDIVKDDSGAFAVFTEQGSSASQMTAAKVMDVIARVPDCDGQAADAVSAYTQVKMEDAPRLLRIPKSACPDSWIRLPRHKWPKSWSNIEDPVVPLERDLYGPPLAGLMWERQSDGSLPNGT